MEKGVKMVLLKQQLMLEAGLTELTKIQSNIMEQAIYYGNIDLWVDKTIDELELCDKKEVEIKALAYFMEKINYGNIDAERYWRDYKYRELHYNNTNRRLLRQHI